MRNNCYNLTIGEKDLAFSRLSSYLREKMEGQDFVDVNQVLQRAVVHENRSRDQRSHRQFRDNNTRDKEKQGVDFVAEETSNGSDVEVCVAEWADTLKNKPITCSFLKPNMDRKDETRLFDILVQGGVIKLKEGHNIPTLESLAKKKYCKWHDSSHTTNECNYL
jgi:hypothetical protein